jgi:FkbM family methyltransferase
MDKKIILFGAGKIGKSCLDAFGSDAVYAFCDNFSAGSELNGKKVISFDELKRIFSDYDVILSVGSSNMVELERQLYTAGIPYSIYKRQLCKRQIELGEYHKIEDEGIFTDKFIEYVKNRKPRVFANIGAASGGYASIAAHFMGEDAEIHVFEPVPEFVKTLHDFFDGDNRIHIIDKAVSNCNGTMELFATVKQNSNNIAHSFTMDKQQTMFNAEYTDECQTLTHTVETIVLDDFFDKTDVDLMLIDIEGAEVLAIEGMEKLIEKKKTTFFLEVHEPYIQAIRADGMDYINAVFKKNGYKIYWCELDENDDYNAERGGVRLVSSDSIRWEHCIVSPCGLEYLL